MDPLEPFAETDSPPLADALPPAEPVPVGLSFGDGFQFGCGFFAAGLLATFIIVLVVVLVLLLLSLAGISLFGDFFGGVPPALAYPGSWPFVNPSSAVAVIALSG